MFKKIYMIFAVILGLNEWLGKENGSFEDGMVLFFVCVVGYYAVRLIFGGMHTQVRSSGGFGRFMMSVLDTSKHDKVLMKNVTDSVNAALRPGRDRYSQHGAQTQNEVNQRYRDNYNAKNDAIWQQNQANQQRGTYAGHQAQNRANTARGKIRW